MKIADLQNKIRELEQAEAEITLQLKAMDNQQIFTPNGKKLWKDRSDVRGKIAELSLKLDTILETRVNIKDLTDESIGEWVIYLGDAGEKEKGRIKSWSEKFVFVVYKCGEDWENFKNHTAVATYPEQLILFSKYQELKNGDE